MKEKKVWLLTVSILVVAMISGVSYALWVKTFLQSGENVVTSDCFDVTFQESNTIQLLNSFPMYDEEGKKLTPYQISVKNKCNQDVNYQMNFEITKNSTMKESYVKVKFQEKEPMLLNQLEETEVTMKEGKKAYILESGMMKPKEEKEYEIRIWMDEEVTQESEGAMNSILESKVVFTASHIYHESILNGADPVLANGLIPVVIENDGEVYKANLDSVWYEYGNQKWANAVVLEDESIEYQNGETIPESNIESYFVWIPKYRYKLWDLGNYEGLTSINSNKVHDIEIIF